MPSPVTYTVSQQAKMLKEFDRTVSRVRGVFVSRYGEELAGPLIAESRDEYAALIPQIPDLGGKQPFTQFLISTAWFLAMYRVLQRHGKTVEEVGLVAFETMQAYLHSYPQYLRHLLGHMTWSRRYLRRLRQRAVESQQRRYPGDYVYTFVPGDGQTFDYGVDYQECASVKFLREQGAEELAPYLCVADVLYSEALGWGLMRTTTLAEGAERCDFRFRKGGETRVAVPGPMRECVQARQRFDEPWRGEDEQ